MLGCPGSSTAGAVGAINAILFMYLQKQLPPAEFAAKLAGLRQAMVRAGLAHDRKGYSLLLESSVYLQDPELGLLALKSLKSPGGELQYVSDEVLGAYLQQLSLNGDISGLCESLYIISFEQRNLTQECMLPDEFGRTFLTNWLLVPTSETLEEEEEEEYDYDTDENERDASEGGEEVMKSWLLIDGVSIDPQTLCAVGQDGKHLSVNK